IGVAEFREKVTPEQIAQAEAGGVDTLAGQPVVLSPRNAYYTTFGPQLVGVSRPANRQDMGRWVRFPKSNTKPGPSPSLQTATARGGGVPQCVLALDTTDVSALAGVRQRLSEAKALTGKGVDRERLAKVLASTRGVRLAITVDDDITGELRLDFDEPVEGLQ